MAEPIRTCAGCRERRPQVELLRFVLVAGQYEPDAASKRRPGRGTYLCSSACGERVRKNKRFPGLAAAAGTVDWVERTGLGGSRVGRV